MINPNCCSYTVRAYAAAGVTLWTADYFRGAVGTTSGALCVACIGTSVFVAGPRCTADGYTYWNLVKFSAYDGSVVSKHDLTSPGHFSPDAGGDIIDLCRGANGSLDPSSGALGVLYDQQTDPSIGVYQGMGSFDPNDLSVLWGSTVRRPYPGYVNYPFHQMEIDPSNIGHLAGEGTARLAIAENRWGDREYLVGCEANTLFWWTLTGFFTKTAQAFEPTANVLGTRFSGFSGWAPNLTEGGAAPGFYAVRFHSMLSREADAATHAVPNGIGLIDDPLGVSYVITIGSRFVQGVTPSTPYDEPALPGFGVLKTDGAIADQGNIARFDDAGTYIRTVSTGTTLSAIATQGLGDYAVGGPKNTLGSVLARVGGNDSKRWTHNHQSVQDMMWTDSAMLITVGDRSRRSDDQSFL